jgi:hypothetical protein
MPAKRISTGSTHRAHDKVAARQARYLEYSASISVTYFS